MKSWCENIVVVIIITTLIEMLLPEGKTQKYIKIVIGVYLIFSIVQPILKFSNKSINFENVISKFQVEDSNEKNYSLNEQVDYLNKIEENLK
jgi:stage III sporulation protein AF